MSWDDIEKAPEEELNPNLIGQSKALAQNDLKQFNELATGESSFNPLDLEESEKHDNLADDKTVSDDSSVQDLG